MNMSRRSLRQKITTRIPGFGKLFSLTLPRAQGFQVADALELWGSAECGSGVGSELAATQNARAYLPELLQRLDVSKFWDAQCGDWNWMSRVDPSAVDFVGADVVSAVVAK